MTAHALVAAQTPQAFRADALRAAHAYGGEATDDAALVEARGGKVVVVPGDPRNLKLTVPRDFVVAEALLAAADEDRPGRCEETPDVPGRARLRHPPVRR